MTTERLIARMNFDAASYALSMAQSAYNRINFYINNALRAFRLSVKKIIGELLG